MSHKIHSSDICVVNQQNNAYRFVEQHKEIDVVCYQ